MNSKRESPRLSSSWWDQQTLFQELSHYGDPRAECYSPNGRGALFFTSLGVPAARFGLIDRPKPFCAIAPGLFQTSFWGLTTHAVRAEGATPDWRSPSSVGSGPFAIAGPCARVPGRYAQPRKLKNLVAHPWSWAIGSSTSAAQMSLEMVVCRQKARPFVLMRER
jgi:hypothetical protein